MLRLVQPSLPKRILVVDDDEGIRSLIELHLRNEGYEVRLAEDAIVAAHALLHEPLPDLVLLDVEMPYWSGLEFATTVLADDTMPCIPIVFITAHERFAQRAEAMGAGCLVKPFFKDALLALVRGRVELKAVVPFSRAIRGPANRAVFA